MLWPNREQARSHIGFVVLERFAGDADAQGMARTWRQCHHVIHHIRRLDAQHPLPAIVRQIAERRRTLDPRVPDDRRARSTAGQLDAPFPRRIDDAQPCRRIEVDAVGLASKAQITGLDDWKTVIQSGDLHFAGETDRIYLNTPTTLSIVDPAWERRIELTSSGSRSAVIWNPWIERAAAFSDMADDGWQRMLCIETANVMEDVVTLAPGASHTLGVSIASKPL